MKRHPISGNYTHKGRENLGNNKRCCFSKIFSEKVRNPNGSVPTREYWMIKDGQASSRSYDLENPPNPPPTHVSKLDRRVEATHRKTENWQLAEGGGWGGTRSRIIRQHESFVLYKSFNTLWCQLFSGGLRIESKADNHPTKSKIKPR
jgi:hypothetical protein